MSINHDGRPTFVYALVDPRGSMEGEIFYIGISLHPWYRLTEHRREPWSSAYGRIWDIEADGFEVELLLLADFANRSEAFNLEYRLIANTPGLCNRHKPTLPWWRQ